MARERAGSRAKEKRLTVAEARANHVPIDWSAVTPPRPTFLGPRTFADYPLAGEAAAAKAGNDNAKIISNYYEWWDSVAKEGVLGFGTRPAHAVIPELRSWAATGSGS